MAFQCAVWRDTFTARLYRWHVPWRVFHEPRSAEEGARHRKRSQLLLKNVCVSNQARAFGPWRTDGGQIHGFRGSSRVERLTQCGEYRTRLQKVQLRREVGWDHDEHTLHPGERRRQRVCIPIVGDSKLHLAFLP